MAKHAGKPMPMNKPMMKGGKHMMTPAKMKKMINQQHGKGK